MSVLKSCALLAASIPASLLLLGCGSSDEPVPTPTPTPAPTPVPTPAPFDLAEWLLARINDLERGEYDSLKAGLPPDNEFLVSVTHQTVGADQINGYEFFSAEDYEARYIKPLLRDCVGSKPTVLVSTVNQEAGLGVLAWRSNCAVTFETLLLNNAGIRYQKIFAYSKAAQEDTAGEAAPKAAAQHAADEETCTPPGSPFADNWKGVMDYYVAPNAGALGNYYNATSVLVFLDARGDSPTSSVHTGKDSIVQFLMATPFFGDPLYIATSSSNLNYPCQRNFMNTLQNLENATTSHMSSIVLDDGRAVQVQAMFAFDATSLLRLFQADGSRGETELV